jgi:late competence protein required for DNA uptake (superfamily II DNA/RNA helicase)
MFKCPRCGNTDPRYIGYLNGQPYCRRCITFSGKEAPQPRPSDKKITLKISYRLSKEQDALARKVLKNFLSGKDSLIHAVTGAGKTELVYYTMAYAISHRMSVGFSAPRRDVIIDLYPRLASAFPEARTIYVIGKHSSVLTGDIILLTNHQLYRYRDYFDLLIMDEIDAFPFKGDPVLNRFAAEAVRGNRILLSATPSKAEVEAMAKHGEVFSMLARYHRHPLPVPKFLRADFSPVSSCRQRTPAAPEERQAGFFLCSDHRLRPEDLSMAWAADQRRSLGRFGRRKARSADQGFQRGPAPLLSHDFHPGKRRDRPRAPGYRLPGGSQALY